MFPKGTGPISPLGGRPKACTPEGLDPKKTEALEPICVILAVSTLFIKQRLCQALHRAPHNLTTTLRGR